MFDYSLESKILFKLNQQFSTWNKKFGKKVDYSMSRDQAKIQRKRLINQKNERVVNKKLKNHIKNYCKCNFGDTAYWPWLALYTELRGEFVEGWIPDDFYRFNILPKLNPIKFTNLSEEKTIDDELFNEAAVTSLFKRINGIYFDKFGEKVSGEKIQEYLYEINCEIVIKPGDGRSGNDIVFVNSRNVEIERIMKGTNLVVQNVLSQHSILNEVYPNSLNTFRVLTHLTSEGLINVKFINLKFGVGGRRVDNISKGGIWVNINSSGKVSDIAFDHLGKKRWPYHPDTDYDFSDLEIPFLDEIKKICRNSHMSFPYVGLIGWDIFVDQSGCPKILEWNANNPWFWKVEAQIGPLWPDHDISIHK